MDNFSKAANAIDDGDRFWGRTAKWVESLWVGDWTWLES